MFVLLVVVQPVGIVAFAASGALAAVRARLDVFGIVVLALTTALRLPEAPVTVVGAALVVGLRLLAM